MKIDVPLNSTNYRPHNNFPDEKVQDRRDSFDNILSKKIEHVQSKSADDVNYNREKTIGSDALSFLETPILGDTSIESEGYKNALNNEKTFNASDDADAKIAQFSKELEKITEELKDKDINFAITDSSLNPTIAQHDIFYGNNKIEIKAVNSVRNNIGTITSHTYLITNSRDTQSDVTQSVGNKNAASNKQPLLSNMQFSEIAAKIFQDQNGVRLILKTGRLTDQERINLEIRVTDLLREFNISNSKVDIFSKQEGAK